MPPVIDTVPKVLLPPPEKDAPVTAPLNVPAVPFIVLPTMGFPLVVSEPWITRAVFRSIASEPFLVKTKSDPPKPDFQLGPISVAAIRKTPDVAGVAEEEINADAVEVVDDVGSFSRTSVIVSVAGIPAPEIWIV
jgi:hypothetical protein